MGEPVLSEVVSSSLIGDRGSRLLEGRPRIDDFKLPKCFGGQVINREGKHALQHFGC